MKNKKNSFHSKNNPQKSAEIRQKTIETCNLRYGGNSSLSCKKVRDKGKITMLNKYGVENIFQRPDIQQKARKNSHSKEANEKRINTQLKRIRATAIEHNCTYVQDLLKQTRSSGWYQAKIIQPIKINGNLFVKNEDIQKVFDYDNNSYKTFSIYEKKIVNILKKNFKFNIIENSRKIISPQELDIYIKDLKLAIEYNGTYFHNNDEYYHLTNL